MEYELDHLVTFTVSAKQNLLKPRDGMRRLREMETSTGIWTIRVRLIVSQKEVVIVEKASGKRAGMFFQLVVFAIHSTSRAQIPKTCTTTWLYSSFKGIHELRRK